MMSTRRKFVVNSSLVILAIAPIVLYAYEYGPLPGFSAAPGDNPTGCIDPSLGCHLGTPNSGKGSVKIVASGGATYVPGQSQTIMVTVTDSTEKKYGFQLSARVDSNPTTLQAGQLVPGTDGYTQTICADGSYPTAKGCSIQGITLEWIEHTLNGYYSSATPPAYTYKFTWIPPTTNVGTVTLYAAGNAVTGNLVVTGTETYLTKLQLSPGTGALAPTIAGIVNDASFVAGGPISSGSWVALFGSNLAPAGDSRLWNTSTEIVNGKLPTNLDGTTVTVAGQPAVVEFISPGQVNIQPPDNIAAGQVPVVVTTTAGGASAAFTATFAAVAPGLFPATAPYIVAQHADNSYVTSASPANPGEVIVLWGTGFGPATPAVPAGQVFTGANPLANTVTATIGGQPATINFAGVVGAGLVQINVQVPAGLSAGNAPVVLTVGGGASTQAANNMIPIQ